MVACLKGHSEVVRVLLANGADVNARTDGGETALSIARDHGREDIVALLLAVRR
jgi:ankyrin repeat protein